VKPKISAHLSAHIAKRLEAAARRPGASKTAIIEAALDQFLSLEGEANDSATILQRLDGISCQLEQLDRDLKIVSETVALHARYQLAITPPLPQSEHAAACALGLGRFEVFATQVGNRVQLGMPLIRETIDRLSAPSHEALVRDNRQPAQSWTFVVDQPPDNPLPNAADPQPQLAAAGQEDGSSGTFPKNYGGRSR
jgi:hypothetical protein